MVSDAAYNLLLKRVELIEKQIKNIKNNPTIEGYASKRLVLNESIDAQKVLNDIDTIKKFLVL